MISGNKLQGSQKLSSFYATDLYREILIQTCRTIKVKRDLWRSSAPTHQPQEPISKLDKVKTSRLFSFLIGISTCCNFRHLFLMPQIGSEKGRDGLRALSFATDYIRALSCVSTSIAGPLLHADLNNKQSSTPPVYTRFLRLDKLRNVLLHE